MGTAEQEAVEHAARLDEQARFLIIKLCKPGTDALHLGPEASELVAWMAQRGWIEATPGTDGGLVVQLKKRE